MIVAYAGGASELPCPRCGRRMARRPVGDVTLDICPECEGVWFDAGELEAAERTLAGETSDFERPLDMSVVAKARLLVGGFFTPRSTLRLFLNPPVKRTYPPEDL